MFKHVWKREFTEDEIMLIGERIWNLGRLLNLREGVEPDALPASSTPAESAFTDGPSAGKAIGEEAFAGGSAGVLPAAGLGRERRADRGQVGRGRRGRAAVTRRVLKKGLRCLTS